METVPDLILYSSGMLCPLYFVPMLLFANKAYSRVLSGIEYKY